MKRLAAALITAAVATSDASAQNGVDPVVSANVERVAPALGAYTREGLFGTVWAGDELSARDRGLVTIAILIARNQTGDLPGYMENALDAGLTPAELSEAITHLAFYAGWGNAMAAVDAAAGVFKARGVTAEDLPQVDPQLLPLDAEAEAEREALVQSTVGPVSQGVVDNTRAFLFEDLWLRPALAPRDRSLVTVVALIASGQVAQMPFHLNRALDNGLTPEEADGVFALAAFYTGWPNVFTAMPVAREVLEAREE